MLKYNILIRLIIIFSITFLYSDLLFADWQNTLEDHFDIVSTFDDLDDWKGTSN